MKTGTKRIALLLCLALLPLGAMAMGYPDYMGDVQVSGDFAYTLEADGTATIVDFVGEPGYTIIVPGTIDGYPVRVLKDLTFSGKSGESTDVVIEEGIEVIEKYALFIWKLYLVQLPGSIREIGDGALGYADEVHVPADHPIFAKIDNVMYNKETKSILHVQRYLEGSFTVPKGILHIGSSAFDACRLSKVLLPEGLLSIGYCAFANMENLRYVNLPESLTEINHYAFMYSWDVEVQYTNGTYAHEWFNSMPDIVMPEHGMGRGDD